MCVVQSHAFELSRTGEGTTDLPRILHSGSPNYEIMGTKRPGCTIFDTLSKINTDRKLQPGGKISRDPSPRSAMTAQSERERDRKREEDWREKEKMRDKARHKDMDPQGYCESYRAPVARLREGQREWRKRERRQEDDRSRIERSLLNIEKETERAVEWGMEKGDTFPRMRKSSADSGRRMVATTEMDEERGERRHRDRPKRVETDKDCKREREREQWRERDRKRDRDEMWFRAKGEGKNIGQRPGENEKWRQRERYQESDVGFQDRRREVGDLWDRRERDEARKIEKLSPNTGKRQVRMPSPHIRRDGEIYSVSKEREKVHRREGRRDTRSEGDSDEREMKRKRERNRKKEELIYQYSRSEGDNTGKAESERDQDRQGCREADTQRYRDRDREREVDQSRKMGVERDRERYREVDRRAAREEERWKESVRDLKDDRNEGDRYREYEQRRRRETKEREADPRWDDTKNTRSRSLSETAPRGPPQNQSSDMDSETKYRRGSYEERGSGREMITGSERVVEKQRNPEGAAQRCLKEQKRSERQESDRGEKTGGGPEQRRMWLEPQRGKISKEDFLDRDRHTRGEERRRREEERSMESQSEWGRKGRGIKEEPDENYLDQNSYRGRHGGRNEYRGDIDWETESVSVDGDEVGEVWGEVDKGGKEHLSDSDGGIEGSQRRDAERKNVTDKPEESDREEEGGSDYCPRSESEGGSETGWKQEKDRMLSGEDGFVTVSSGGDDEDEREDDDGEMFEDCQEFWEGGVTCEGPSPVAIKVCEGDKEKEEEWTVGKEEVVDDREVQGRDKRPKYVYCVIGQTLPRSKTNKRSPSHVDQIGGVERDDPNLASSHHCSDDTMQQPQVDLHLTLSRNDEYRIISNQDTESKSECNVPQEERVAIGETSEVDIRLQVSSVLRNTETGEVMRSKKEHPYAELGTIKRDSPTERLLIDWREKNKEGVEREQISPIPSNSCGDVCTRVNFEQIQPILDGINIGVISPEEVEAIRIRMSRAWSMSEEPTQRHSQAPHLKWAENVVQEILGCSEEGTVGRKMDYAEVQANRGVDQSEAAMLKDKRQDEAAEGTGEIPVVRLTTDEQHSEPELEEEEPLEVEGLRGMGQSQADVHADQFTAIHGDTPTYTHGDTTLDTEGKEDHSMDKETEPSGHLQSEKTYIEVKISEEAGDEVKVSEMKKEGGREKEVEMNLTVSNMLYKPHSCPFLNYECDSDIFIPSREGEAQEVEDRMGESEEERQGGEPKERGTAEDVGKMREGEGTEEDNRKGEVVAEMIKEGGTLTSSFSVQDLVREALSRRRGIRKTTERRTKELVEEEGVGRDRRTRIFSTSGKVRRLRLETLVTCSNESPKCFLKAT